MQVSGRANTDLSEFKVFIFNTCLVLSEALDSENLFVMCHEFRTHRVVWEEEHDDNSNSHCDEADD